MKPDPSSGTGVYLATSGREVLTGRLGKLAGFYQLDVHGTAFLGNRARIEMGYAALLLTLIFCFDMMAWTLLFNSIFHFGLLKFGWMTLLAIPMALLFSLAIFIYERQFIAADSSEGLVRYWIAVLIRMLVLLMAALITAQPVELFIFQGPIQSRIHEEGILKEVVNRRKQLEEAKVQALGIKPEEILEHQTKSLEYQELEGAKNANRQAQVALEECEKKLAGAEAELGRLTALHEGLERSVQDLEKEIEGLERRQETNLPQLTTLRKELIEAEKRESRRSADFLAASDRADAATAEEQVLLNNEVTRVRAEYDAAKKEVEALAERIDELNKAEEIRDKKNELSDLKKERNKVSGQLEAARLKQQQRLGEKEEAEQEKDEATRGEESSKDKFDVLREQIKEEAERFKKEGEADVNRLRNWVRELQSREPGEEIQEAPMEPWPFSDPPWSYSDERYDFFRQLRVLSDLRTGKPTRWPDVSEEVKASLTQEYGLENVSALGAEARQRREEESEHFRYTYYVVYFIALVIPLLVLAFKFLMASELRSYYNGTYQARLGHPDAVAYSFARRRSNQSGLT